MMHVLDLFSGIGGFSLGLERAGFRTAAFCEIDPYCRKVLARHWPYVPIHTDIRKLDGTRFAGTVDLVCGGYPCQPFSAAGKQQGESDPRHFWPEMHRIIREARPRWVVCENVRGHVRLGFDTVASQLEDDGFTVWPFIVPACAVGAPHRRDRLWILARQPGDGRGAWRMWRPDPGGQGRPEPPLQALSDAAPRSRPQGATPSDQRSLGGGDDHSDAAMAHAYGKSPLRATVAWEERYPWAVEPDVDRVAHGVSSRVDRLRALGNAVVPQIPELIGRAMMTYEQQMEMAA